MSAPVAAVITAGGRVDGEFERAIGTDVKALARIGNRTMLERTVDAVRDAGVDRIAVVGGAQVRAACERAGVTRAIEEARSGEENVQRALQAWDGETRLLYLTSDMPFVTGDALRWLLDAASPGELGLPLTAIDAFEARFPGAPPFGITLGGERVVNGGAFVIPPGAAPRVAREAARLFRARKSPLRMASLAGVPLLLRYAFRRLRIADLELEARRRIGTPARAVRNAPPELAYDTDTYMEYCYAAQHAGA